MARKFGKFLKILIVLVLLALVINIGTSFYKQVRYPLSYSKLIKEYAAEYNLDPYLVAGIISVESGFDKDAKSSQDAKGLMQIGPSTADWGAESLGIEDFKSDMLYDPETNIKIGCWYLDNLSKEFKGDLKLILAAYNGGSGNVAKWLKDERYSKNGIYLEYIPFKETREYVDKVIDRREAYRKEYGHAFMGDSEDNPILPIINRLKKIVKDRK